MRFVYMNSLYVLPQSIGTSLEAGGMCCLALGTVIDLLISMRRARESGRRVGGDGEVAAAFSS